MTVNSPMRRFAPAAPWFMVGICLCFMVIHDPLTINPGKSLTPPSITFPGGTDRLGRDVLARASSGFRSSLCLAGMAEVLALSAAIGVNFLFLILARMKIKALVAVPMRALRTVPPFLTGLALAFISFPFETAVVEEEINAGLHMPHIEGAMGIGAPYYMILMRHVGRIAGPRIMRYALLDFVGLVAFESLLGFVGLSRPPAPSIGAEIFNGGPYMATYPWLFLTPCLVLALGLVALNAGFFKLLNRGGS